MQSFIVQWHVAVGTAGCDTTPLSRTWSRRTKEVVALHCCGFMVGVLDVSQTACPEKGWLLPRKGRGEDCCWWPWFNSRVVCKGRVSPALVQLQWTMQCCRQLLRETVNYTTFSSAPYWQTGETKMMQCKQIWWKAEEITDVNRITPAREEERSPISLSYLTLQSTIQEYYLLYDKRVFIPIWCEVALLERFFSVFSKILLVSQRENRDYTSKPWASMPIAYSVQNQHWRFSLLQHLGQFLFSERLLELDDLPLVRQEPL